MIRNRSGYTITEMIIVLVIFGLGLTVFSGNARLNDKFDVLAA